MLFYRAAKALRLVIFSDDVRVEERKGGQRSIWLVDTRKDITPSPYRNETNEWGGYSHEGTGSNDRGIEGFQKGHQLPSADFCDASGVCTAFYS